MNLQQFTDEGYRAELIRSFSRDNAEVLLGAINYPPTELPAPGPMGLFWTHVLQEIENGIVVGGFEALLREAAIRYPGNEVFARQSRDIRQQPARRDRQPGPAAVVHVTGHRSVREVLEVVHHVTSEDPLPGSVRPGIITDGAVLLELSDMPTDQVAEFRERLEAEAQRRNLHWNLASASGGFRDYLIRSLFVEGPDQARFELNDVPGSTTIRDIARATMEQYDPKTQPLDRNGKPRPAVVDHIQPDGTATRLNPDTSLDQNNIGEGANLHVSAESTAGTVNPLVREEALIRVRLQVGRYAQHNPTFEVQVNADVAPTDYLFKFAAPGWGPPASAGGEPVPIDDHEVYLALPADFPMKAPEAFWQSPIFHPNVDRNTGFVCLGALADRYRPGMDFGNLCQTLVDMASYRNYSVEEGYDRDAQRWAISLSGQAAIERRGGRSLIRNLLQQAQPPRRLEIRRSDQ